MDSAVPVSGRRSRRFAAFRRKVRRDWRIFRSNRLALFGVALLLTYSLAPLAYGLLRQRAWKTSTYDPITGFDVKSAPHPAPPSWIAPDRLAEDNVHRLDQNRPSFAHLLGTDTVGRDVLAVLLASTGHSFIVGLTAALTTAGVALLLAAWSAYYQGWVDAVIGRISDGFLLLPAPIFMIAVGGFMRLHSTSALEIIYFKISGQQFSEQAERFFQPLEFGLIYGIIAGIGSGAIFLRSHGLKVMTLSFIEAARVAGAGDRQIIWQHLIPHMAPLAAVYTLITVTGAIVADGFLSFFGFNPDPLNWGTMIYNAFAYDGVMMTGFPWNAIIAPALAISLFAGAFYLISRGVQDVVDRHTFNR